LDVAVWAGIAVCISQSAVFSGLNLALFSVSRLRLEAEVSKGNPDAIRVLSLREDTNMLLTTILWGNVGINVLLTLLSNSVLAGVSAFLFSTLLITFIGEIIPQAYFSRSALRLGALLCPLVKMYRFLLFPVAKPTALVLDYLLGPEAIHYYDEEALREVIRVSMKDPESRIATTEGKGAINFLSMDDLGMLDEGEIVDAESIIQLPTENGRAIFPDFKSIPSDPFLQKLHASGHKWAIVVDESETPCVALDVDGFLRATVFQEDKPEILHYAHRPVVIRDPKTRLGAALPLLRVRPRDSDDDVIDEDILLYWGESKRIITGADLLGRLLRGISRREKAPPSFRQG